MLFNGYDILISFSCQQFQCNSIRFFLENDKEKEMQAEFKSTLATESVLCMNCGGSVHTRDVATTILQDMPIVPGLPFTCEVTYHRFFCPKCRRSFTEDICLQHPGTRITERAAQWVKSLLQHHMTISAVSKITGFHWETIQHIHKEMMESKLEEREKQLEKEDYKPKHLAVDEFAIHKGHTYATCVMDLDTGDVLWVGKGRAKKDFEHFFNEYDLTKLDAVEAVAMDMNASYNRLVEKYLPKAVIVYDRYHMQAQYGKDVLGSVRLAEARAHKNEAESLKKQSQAEIDPEKKKQILQKAKEEQKNYRKLKGARWRLLTKRENLKEDKARSLDLILESHKDLAICYAMREEMCKLYELRDLTAATEGWIHWFEAAKASGIPALMKFASLKERRIFGLISHAAHPISTGRLEGMNNKIKVAKRNAYGYRNDAYFFTLIRYLSIFSKL